MPFFLPCAGVIEAMLFLFRDRPARPRLCARVAERCPGSPLIVPEGHFARYRPPPQGFAIASPGPALGCLSPGPEAKVFSDLVRAMS
ncbi:MULTISPECIES: hypothetical protein [unclassified Haematobacter]|uniref:hypothetical protein n=1 Tax=unclassified Haematobacter TaxID=2640585 RepID=UPI0025BB5589|nr:MULTISPECIES: hypothetical protein [unclassified Haematobacter]